MNMGGDREMTHTQHIAGEEIEWTHKRIDLVLTSKEYSGQVQSVNTYSPVTYYKRDKDKKFILDNGGKKIVSHKESDHSTVSMKIASKSEKSAPPPEVL